MNAQRTLATGTLLALGILAAVRSARANGPTTVEISGPIFPMVGILYTHEGANYPATLPAEEALVDSVALTFPNLLTTCAATDPNITISASSTLTPPQLAANYNGVANCAYTQYTSKPYWIPELVDNVDICSRMLGASWHLPTEAEIDGLTAAEVAALSNTLSTVASSGSSSMGSFYFSLKLYVRGTDGSLKVGDLGQSSSPRVSPLTLSATEMKSHYEGNGDPLSLRCIQVTTSP
jgi:hypothetical protein